MLNAFDPGLSLWVAAADSFFISVFLIKSRLSYLAIPIVRSNPPVGTRVDCMVVIPARNEETSIGRSVRSFPKDAVIVVDDHSEDGTAEAARKAGAGVIPAPPLPRGAVGKSNACGAGARLLHSRWILFADADTWVEEGFIETVVGYAEAKGLAFLSIYLQPECETWAEHILVPLAVALYFSGVNTKSDPAAVSNGQCLLARREAYDFVGGHGAVYDSVSDDVKLAGLAKRHRMKFAIVRAPHLGHVRIHGGFREIWSGFKRNASRFVVVSPWIGVRIMVTATLLALWLPALAWLVLNRQWIVAGPFALLPTLLLWRWYQSGWRALLAPIAIYGMLPILWNGLFSAITGRRIRWKGRTI